MITVVSLIESIIRLLYKQNNFPWSSYALSLRIVLTICTLAIQLISYTDFTDTNSITSLTNTTRKPLFCCLAFQQYSHIGNTTQLGQHIIAIHPYSMVMLRLLDNAQFLIHSIDFVVWSNSSSMCSELILRLMIIGLKAIGHKYMYKYLFSEASYYSEGKLKSSLFFL